jgi:molybdopterin molybdotransferase
MLFGHRGTQRVLGLPGNPVSSLITGRVFLVPLVQRLLGLAETAAPSRMARLTHALEANGPRTHYMRAMLTHGMEEGGLVTAIGDQDSSLISVLARSNALIVRDAAAPAVAAGTQVAVLALDF